MIKVGIIGATGYAGTELVRLIYGTIAKTYSLTHNHNESIKYSNLSYLHFSKVNKEPHKKYAYFSLAIAHNNNRDFYQSKSIHKELIDSATLKCDTAFLLEVLESYSHLLWNNQKSIESKQILKETITNKINFSDINLKKWKLKFNN